MIVKADFHIHSCLSPCASLEMSPGNILKKAEEAGLNWIALTDHNSSLNCQALYDLSKKSKVRCLFGLEVTSVEEVHLLTLFDNLESASSFGEWIYENLPDIPNQIDRFGDQVVVDASENIIEQVEKYLGLASNLSISEIIEDVHSDGGIVIPAHIDRPLFGIISQLGFLPFEKFDGIEISRRYYANQGAPIKNAEKYTAITNSDSHDLDSIGKAYNIIDTEDYTIEALKEALIKKRINKEINSL